MVNMVFENARHVYLKVRTFLCILIYEFPNTNKMGTGLQSSLHYLWNRKKKKKKQSDEQPYRVLSLLLDTNFQDKLLKGEL